MIELQEADKTLSPEAFLEKYKNVWAEHQPDFRELLYEHVQRMETTDAQIAQAAAINKSTLSRILSGRTSVPSRSTTLTLALSLHLDAQETQVLLTSRDRHDSFPIDKRDFLILYCIIRGEFNLTTVNLLLDAYGCELLGEA